MCTDDHLKLAGKSNFTDTDVTHWAVYLMGKYGQTTTLDVKNGLRKDGFTATQADVSLAMDRLAIDNGWPWDFNGTYRTFYPSSVPASVVVNDPTTKIVIKSFTQKAAERPVYTVSPSDGDWQVFDYQQTKPAAFVKQGVSRNTARNWYSKVYGVEYIDVAANVYHDA